MGNRVWAITEDVDHCGCCSAGVEVYSLHSTRLGALLAVERNLPGELKAIRWRSDDGFDVQLRSAGYVYTYVVEPYEVEDE